MAKESLAIRVRPRNYNLGIYWLIRERLQKHYASPDRIHYDGYSKLGALVGLGFTAVLAEGGTEIDLCKSRVDAYVRYRDIALHRDKIDEIAVTIAEIIQYAMYSFHKLEHPLYYEDFTKALRQFFILPDRTPEENEKETQHIIKKLLDELDKKTCTLY